MSLHTPPNLTAPPLRRRLAAFVYEGVLLFGVLMIAGLAFSTLTQQRHALQGRLGLQAVVFGVLALVLRRILVTGGADPGHEDLAPAPRGWHGRWPRVTWPRGLLRYVLAWIWFVPPLVLVWAMGWHSSAASTPPSVHGSRSMRHPPACTPNASSGTTSGVARAWWTAALRHNPAHDKSSQGTHRA